MGSANNKRCRRHQDSLVVLDLDDTLVDTSEVYYSAREKFLEQMVYLGFSRPQVLEIFERIETKNIRLLGIFPERYKLSMMETYQRLCLKKEIETSKKVENRIQRIGSIINQTMPKPLPEAIALLRWLYGHYFVVLVTRGVDHYQREKIEAAGIKPYIHKYFIVKKKSASILKQIAKSLGRDIRSAWVLGDSIRSDINPGIKAGARCILYEYRHKRYYWRQEYGEEPAGEYFLAKTLADVRQIMESPDTREKQSARLFRRSSKKKGGTH